jgi:hypothetical protein
LRTGAAHHLQRHLDAGVRPDARLPEADRILVVAVEQVVDASEQREVRGEAAVKSRTGGSAPVA